MVYLIGWSGRGWVALIAVAIPLVTAFVTGTFTESGFLLAFSLGFMTAGLLCWLLGRKWNGGEKIHLLGPFRMEKWGIVYFALGALLLPAGIGLARGTFG